MVLMTTTDVIMRKTSQPTGSSKVRPFLGIPRLLSSNRFVGASGRPDLFFPVILSVSLKASSTLLPSSAFLMGFGSESRVRNLAAFNFSLAVNFNLFGVPFMLALSVTCFNSEGSGVFLRESVGDDWLLEMDVVAVSEVLSLVSVVMRSPFATKRGLTFVVCIGLLKRRILEGDEK